MSPEQAHEDREVHLHVHGAIGHISLNRPRALHALTQGMCEAMSAKLLAWRDDPAVEAVILDHAEGRGFCAGGDVQLVRRSALEDGGAAGRAFFHAEYRLNHLMFTYPKPIVAFMDGVTMGGGVGISQPARFRVATENTLFAMPEGAIGLFPDVGAGWYLPRLKGRTGVFLALTGARFDGAECHWAGLATHYLSSESLAEAKARIIAEPGAIEAILADLSAEPPTPRVVVNEEAIGRLFASDDLEIDYPGAARGRERLGGEGTQSGSRQVSDDIQGRAAPIRRRGQPPALRRRDGSRIPHRRADDAAGRLRRGRARRAGRQGQRPALGSCRAGRRHTGHARRHFRPAGRRRGVDAVRVSAGG